LKISLLMLLKTDDLVTAYVAAKQVEASRQSWQGETFHYLDLGCGNGSVLTMTTWKTCQILAQRADLLKCIGVEARKEALELCRRSLAFNVGLGDNDRQDELQSQEGVCPIEASVRRGDFRELETMLLDDKGTTFQGKFDLVTGTPPYFRVDFKVAETMKANDNDSEPTPSLQVEKAVINQGGMPTCLQSAPARCEFRGGIEAYCRAAAFAMKPSGTFVVCENWLNDARVRKGASDAGLNIVELLPVKGSVDRPEPLFAVYIMKKVHGHQGSEDVDKIPGPETTKVHPCLSVRDGSGKWTKEYAKEVLEWMSIPAEHEMSGE
jgi:tRNA1(Val) A37 N6-methylase TrmN6